jgi:hypothetical protein
MAIRQHTSTSIRNAAELEADAPKPTAELLAGLNALGGFATTAAKHGFKLGAHTHYSSKAHATLVEIRRTFLELKANYQHEQHPAVAAQLDALEGPLKQLEQGLELNATKLKDIIRDVVFKVGSDLRAAIEAEANHWAGAAPFITPEILSQVCTERCWRRRTGASLRIARMRARRCYGDWWKASSLKPSKRTRSRRG